MSLTPRIDKLEHNKIINGNFDFWQRGASFTSVSNTDYTADRFLYLKNGSMVHDVLRSGDAPSTNSNYSLLVDCTTADASIATSDRAHIAYRVEGHDYLELVNNKAMLSFWVKATKTGVNCISFKNSGSDRSYVVEYTINSADTWEKKSVAVEFNETGGTWDYTNGIGLDINFTLASGTDFHTTPNTWQSGNYLATANQVNNCDSTSNNFQLAQVMLNRGEIAGEFSRAGRNVGGELALCQRYYCTGQATVSHQGGATDLVDEYVFFPVSMRAIPTIGLNVVTTSNAAPVSASTAAVDTFLLRAFPNNGTTAHVFWFGDYTADAEL